jgi:hypothetical protein
MKTEPDDKTSLFRPGVDDALPERSESGSAHFEDRRRKNSPEGRLKKRQKDRMAKAERIAARARDRAQRTQGANLLEDVFGDWSGGVPRGVQPLPLEGDFGPQPPPRGAGILTHEEMVPQTATERRRESMQRAHREHGAVLDPADDPGRRDAPGAKDHGFTVTSISVSTEDWDRITTASQARRDAADARGSEWPCDTHR